MNYIAIIHKDNSSDYGVSFPDFPGCITAGETVDDAKDMALEALNFHVHGMVEDGEDLPAPTSIDDIMQDPDFRDGVAFLITITPPSKTVRVNITMTEHELNAIDQAARASGKTRSAYLVQSGLHSSI